MLIQIIGNIIKPHLLNIIQDLFIKGFYIFPSSYTGSDVVYLRFGELDGTKKWDSDLCISWPDGSKDKIRVQHAMRWNQEGYPEYYTAFKVNGVPVDGWLIHLTK